MTNKQAKRYAKEIYGYEKIRQDPSSTKEEKLRAEERIMSITNQIMALHDGIEAMLEIDEIIQNLENKN